MSEFHDDDSLDNAHDDEAPHVDERWLVSYADMMTLLFGLFVLLFSIADEKKGDMNQHLKEISESSFSKNTPQPTPDPISEPIPEEQKPEDIDQVLTELKELKIQTETLQQKLIEKQNLEVKLTQQLEEEKQTFQNQMLLKEEAELKLKNELLVAEQQLNIKNNQKPIVDKEAQLKTVRLEAEINTIKNQLAKEKLETQKVMQKLASSPRTPASNDNTKLLNQKVVELETKNKEIDLKNQELLDQAQEIETKNQELTQKIKELEQDNMSVSDSMIVILKWSTDKHDLDLKVTDPNGKVFEFKNKLYKGYPGELTLDSRSGPGAEIWQTNKIIPGNYTVTWKLYNSYNNPNDVVYSGSISSSRSRIPINTGSFKSTAGAQKTIKFQATGKGNLKLLK